MCNAEVEKIEIPSEIGPMVAYQVTYRDFTVGCRKVFNVYAIQAMASYIAKCINEGLIDIRVET